MHGIKSILWDWNGTLLNDIDICIDSMNILLERYTLPCITRLKYKEIFKFPVLEYYKELGFDFSKLKFIQIAHEFYEEYLIRLPKSDLFPHVEEYLQQFKNQGYNQYVISAMEHKILINSIKIKGIYSYFKDIAGLDDIYAVSKSELTSNFLQTHEINPKNALFIGDTTHDYEVAQSCHCNHVLIADGHQSYDILRKVTKNVIKTLSSINKWLN